MENRAAELILQIERRAIERIHRVLLWSLMVALPGLVLIGETGDVGVLVGLLTASGTTLGLMLWSQREIGRIVGQVALLYALAGRVAEFRVPAHIVGREV